VLADIDNRDGSLRGGGTVNATVIVSARAEALTVPEQSVVLRPAGKVVYVIAEVDGQKKAQQKTVKAGAKRGGRIEILEGLAGGETIALDGAGFLTNNAAVAIKEAAKAGGAKAAAGPKVPEGTQRAGAGATATEGADTRRPDAAKREMTLPELSVKRHVLAWMLNAVLVLFGVIAFTRIGMDRLPYIEFPVVSVTTALKGANPDIVDASVTNLIEGAVNSVPGIEHIQSTSSPGVSVVNITFGLEKNVDVAFNEVQSKVNQVLRRLPKDVDPPVVAKVETNASPIFWMALQGDRTQQQLNQYALNVVKKKLETIDGVGEVRLGGRRDRTIRVNLLPDRMTALGVSAQDISDAFAREHVQLAGGFVVGQTTEHLVKLDLEFHTARRARRPVVGYRGTPLRRRRSASPTSPNWRTASPTTASWRASTARPRSAWAWSRWPTPIPSPSPNASRRSWPTRSSRNCRRA
jgi:hypothetical protein